MSLSSPTGTASATLSASFTPTFTLSFTPTPIPAGPLTIDYTYDALNRLTGAIYSDGRSFDYTYDAAGNVLELEQNLGPGTVITTYTYDDANQLDTALQGSNTWQYTYDANGSLISDGVKTYTYDSANRLIQVSDQSSVVSMDYNGLGQRLSMDAAGVIAHYVMDGDQPLTATSGSNTTFYLYGLGAIAEKTDAWSYSLPDGTNTPRQLSNLSGGITLAARYTPWGDTLDTYGTGDFTFGYFGGVMDAATGLLYVGNGQYYDPATGRFLTRGADPDSTNPYVPWNPTGAIIGPLAAMALFFGKRKKGSKWGTLFVLLLFASTVSMTLAACGGGGGNNQQQSQPSQIPNANQTSVDTGPGTATGSGESSSGSANQSPTYTPCPPTPISTSTSTPIPTPTSTPPPTSTPIPINCDELSDFRARRACRTYLALRDHPGWWNGNQTGTLTPQAFAGLLFRMEFTDYFKDIEESIQQETVVRNFYAQWLYGWTDCKGDTRLANDMFCFIGVKNLIEPASGRQDLQMNPTDSTTTIAAKWVFDPRWSTADFESVFLNPPAAWTAGDTQPGIGFREWVPDERSPSGQSFVYTAPMDWAGISQYGKHEGEARRLVTEHRNDAQGLAPWQFYRWAGGGDTATIVTLSQRDYWKRP